MCIGRLAPYSPKLPAGMLMFGRTSAAFFLRPFPLILFVASACGSDFRATASRVPETDLRVQKVVTRDSLRPGDTASFTVTVENGGRVTVSGVSVGDTLPAGLVPVAVTASHGTYSNGEWQIGSLAVGVRATLRTRVRADSTAVGRLVINRARVSTRAFGDTVPANDTASARVQVFVPPSAPTPPAPSPLPPPPPAIPPSTPALVFSSDWSNATGNTEGAIADGGRWDQLFWCGRDDIMFSVPGSTVNWTASSNVMQVRLQGVNGCRAIQRARAVPARTTHWGRMYIRNDETQFGESHHNFSYNFAAPIQAVFFNRRANANGTGWNLNFWMRNGPGNGFTYPVNTWIAQNREGGPEQFMTFAHRIWYRYEWQVEYLPGGTRFRFWPRIYDMAGNLLADYRNFYHLDTANLGLEPSFNTLEQWYNLGNAFAVDDAELMRNIGIGNEGRLNTPNNGQAWYVANFAISTQGWIGR
jgi:uncharacterized repeat protein (TIGR01451 family)